MEISTKQTIFSIDSKNKRCNDCGEKHISYVSINNGVTICNLCVQIHRQMGSKFSQLKKIDEEFDDYTMNFFIYGGNKNFHKFMKELGVNSSVQRSKLYKTKGADYYRKYLLAKVKGVENTAKKPLNPNELMDDKNNNDNDNDTDDNDDNNIHEEHHNIKEDKQSINNIHNFLNINNNLGNKTSLKDEEINHVESNIQLNLGNTNIQTDEENKETKVKKNFLRSSLNKMKKIGGYIKKNSIKGIKAVKKAGSLIAKKSKPAAEKIKSTAKYMGEHIPYFHKLKFKSQDNIRAGNNFEDLKNTENVETKEDKKDEEKNNNQIEL